MPAPVNLGRYRLLRRLGAGGSGEVWEAEMAGPSGFRKRVAVKVLRADVVRPGAEAELHREARLGALLSHPNLVATLDLGEQDGTWFVVMELVHGPSVGALLARGPLEPAAVLDVGIGTAAALSHVHTASVEGRGVGIVHCDVKPDNLLVDPSGQVKLTDLGVAAFVGASGRVAGTLGFMAPEQQRGHPCPASDLYALGATLVVAATGRDVDDPLEAVSEVDARIPGLGVILSRCLQRDPAARWESAAALQAALEDLRGGLAGAGLRPEATESTGSGRDTWTEPPRLPVPDTALVGREAELARLLEGQRALERLVTVTGPPGVGKSRLVIEAARGSEAPALLVALAGAASAASAVALALDIAVPAPEGRSTALASALAERGPLLLILDDAERLTDSLAELVPVLLSGAPQLLVRVASRRTLGVPGEVSIELAPLSLEAAVALLELESGGPADAADLAAVAEALDRLPLALRLAARRSRRVGFAAIRGSLSHRLRMLGGGPRGRHESLRAALDASLDTLSELERHFLGSLTVFTGAFSPEAAEAVLRPGADQWVLDLLDSLVGHSLVRLQHDSGRFVLLTTVREWASSLLEPPDVRRAEERHALWFCQTPAERGLRELPEITAALARSLDWGRADLAVSLALSAVLVGVSSGHLWEDPDPILRALALPGADQEPGFETVLRHLAAVLGEQGRGDELLPLLEGRAPTADLQDAWGITRYYQRRFPEALACLEEALELRPDPRHRAALIGRRAAVLRNLGRVDDALEGHQRSAALLQSLGHSRAAQSALGNVAATLIATRRWQAAHDVLQRVLASPDTNRVARSLALANLAVVLQVSPLLDRPAAWEAQSEARAAFARLGMVARWVEVTGQMVRTALNTGQLDDARSLLAEAESRALTLRDASILRTITEVSQARILAHQHDVDGALAALRHAFERSPRNALPLLVMILREQGCWQQVIDLIGQARPDLRPIDRSHQAQARYLGFGDEGALSELIELAADPGKVDADTPFLLLNTAEALFEAGQRAQAAELGRRAVLLAGPGEEGAAVAQLLLARISIAQGDPQAAQVALERSWSAWRSQALTWPPHEAVADLVQAQLLAVEGRAGEATEAFERAERVALLWRMHPTGPLARELNRVRTLLAC